MTEISQTMIDYVDLQDELDLLTTVTDSKTRTLMASNIIKKADTIFQTLNENVKGGIVDELSIDLNIIKKTGDVIHEELLKFNTVDTQYCTTDFAKALLSRLGTNKDGELNWDRMPKQNIYGLSVLHTKGYLHGAYVNAAPERKPISQKKPREAREKEGPVKAPENVTSTKNTEEGSEIIQTIKEIILKEYDRNGGKPICYFSLICDPNDFGTTIDNIFQLSFLVRDSFIEIFNAKDGLKYVKPLSKKEKQSSKFEEQSACQTIISLNMDQWESIIRVFNIQTPMINIPNRYDDNRNADNSFSESDD